MKSTEIVEGKPQIILHYNSTKGGTDTFDQLNHAYTVTRKTNRWSMRFFFGILDQAAVNARILLQCAYNIVDKKEKIQASACLKSLAVFLAEPHLKQRLNNRAVRTNIQTGIRTILNLDTVAVQSERPKTNLQQRCALCPRKKDKKTKMICPSCERTMCDDHRVYLCEECAGHD